jgi:glycogen synthase
VVMFFITRQPYHSIDPDVLQSRAVLDEIEDITTTIQDRMANQFFLAAASSEDGQLPDLNQFVDEYWRLRLRRTVQTWHKKGNPKTVTHNLKSEDQLTRAIQYSGLNNGPKDPVKIIYHPDFVNSTNPLFGIDYNQFVRGCHMGIFPSYYEPWGYTPLECIARGVPTVTSDLSGFGDYIMQIMQDYTSWGIDVIERKKKTFDECANELSEILLKFVTSTRRDRIVMRNRVESISETFDWNNLRQYYDAAHDLALKRKK